MSAILSDENEETTEQTETVNGELIEEIEEIDDFLEEVQDEVNEDLDAIEIFESLKRNSGKSAQMVFVYRLLSYENDFREDAAAEKEFLDKFPVTAEIEDVIKRKHGGGHYFVQLRIDGKVKTFTVIHISGEPKTASKPKPETTTAAPMPPQYVINPMESFAENFKIFKQMIGLQQPPQTIEQKSLKEQLLEAKELVDLVSPKQQTDTNGKTVWDVVNTALIQLPKIVSSGAALLKGNEPDITPFMKKTNLRKFNPESRTLTDDEPEETEPIEVETNEPEETEDMNFNPIAEFGDKLFNSLKNNEELTEAKQIITDFVQNFPFAKSYIDSFLDTDAKQLISMLESNEDTAHFAKIPKLALKLQKLKKLISEDKNNGS